MGRNTQSKPHQLSGALIRGFLAETGTSAASRQMSRIVFFPRGTGNRFCFACTSMPLPLSRRESRTVSIGLLILVFAFALRFGALPWIRNVAELRATLDQAHLSLEKERNLVMTPARGRGLADATTRPGTPVLHGVLTATTESAAHGELTAIVTQAAAASPVQLDVLTPSSLQTIASGLSSVAMRVVGSGDLRGLITFFAMLEQNEAVLSVDQLRMNVSEGETFPRSPAETVAFDFGLSALLISDSVTIGLSHASGTTTVREGSDHLGGLEFYDE